MRAIKSAFLALVITATGLVLGSSPASAAGTFLFSTDYIGSPEAGRLRVYGWAFDDDAMTTSIAIHVYVGGGLGDPAAWGYALIADQPRPDVAAAYGSGEAVGFDNTIDVSVFGNQPVYVYAINVPGTPGDNQLIGSSTGIDIADPNPIGALETVTSPTHSQVRLRGWTADPSDKSKGLQVQFYEGTSLRGTSTAGLHREDLVGSLYGSLHGFDVTLATSPGFHEFCATAVNVGPGGDTALGCRTVTVAAPPPPPPPPPPPTVPPVVGAPGTPAVTRISLKVRAVKKKSKLRVDVGPDLVESNYAFRVQRRRRSKWRTVSQSQTLGPRDRMTLDFKRGKYRVVVPAQHGLKGARATVRLKR